jgi:hypothetical protein
MGSVYFFTNAHRATKQTKLRPYSLQVMLQLQQRNKAAGIQNCHWLYYFVREGVLVQ